MATAKEPSESDQFRRLIVEQHLCGPMDSLTRAKLALGCSIPTEIQKLLSEQEIAYTIKAVARAIDEAVAADKIQHQAEHQARHEAFEQALENPPPANAKLRKLLRG